MSDDKKTPTAEVTKKEKSQVEITGEIDAETFASYEEKALEALGKEIEIQGFRKGKAPKDVLLKHVGEGTLLQEMAERAISRAYPDLLQAHNINAIGQPAITITKLAKGNPLGFKIQTAVIPEVVLPDYTKIAKKEGRAVTDDGIEITEEEIEQTMRQIQEMRAQMYKQEGKELPDNGLPEVDDAFVKTLGDFTSVADFKEKIKENIKLEKLNQAREKNRLTIVEAIIADTKIDLPEIIIEAEIDNLLHRIKGDIANTGMSFEEYLKQIQKSEEDMRADVRGDAEKRAKFQLVVNKIAVNENLMPDKEAIEKEATKLMEQYKDADPHRVRAYVESTLLTENVLTYLESQAEKKAGS